MRKNHSNNEKKISNEEKIAEKRANLRNEFEKINEEKQIEFASFSNNNEIKVK